MKQLTEAIEQEQKDNELIKLLDETYEQEQLDREATEYGYGNIRSNRVDMETYMAIEYKYLTAQYIQ